MSPRWMMDSEFEVDGFEYYNSDDEEDDRIYNSKYGYHSSIYMGDRFIRTIYIGYTDCDGDYDDLYDY
jgi:hypothetical protein